jgi:hypothetical protein
VRPLPRSSVTARPGASATPLGQRVNAVGHKSGNSGDDLPVGPPVAAAVLLVGLGSGLMSFRRRSRV